MNKLYIKNALVRSERARLLLAFRYRIQRPFRWFGLGRYKVDPHLVGVMDGSILVASISQNDANATVTSLEEIGFNTITKNGSRSSMLGNTVRNWRASAFFAIVMCTTLQYFVWQLLDDRSIHFFILSLSYVTLLASVVAIPKIFQTLLSDQELRTGLEVLKNCEINDHTARTQHSVAAIFPSNAFRYFQVYLFLFVSISWLLAPIYYFYANPNSTTFILYLAGVPTIVSSSTILNHRVLNHEVSWILNAEYLLIYSNIWWGPKLEIPIGEVKAFIQERGRVRIKFSSRADYSLFINGPKDALTEAIEWTNELLDIRAESLSKTTGDLKT